MVKIQVIRDKLQRDKCDVSYQKKSATDKEIDESKSLKPDGPASLTNPREKKSRFWGVEMYLGCWFSWDFHSAMNHRSIPRFESFLRDFVAW